MSYTALYRKFRPDNFIDVKGQEHIVTTLKNQILSNRIGHAYLFTGIRGTGKTTLAKILAKAVNCQNLQDGSPCGVCDMCKEISLGASMNVIEIDAASNNGVDNIREIIEEVAYSPTKGRYKVYIIDEVHMLSAGAFNALLKTLEEPPEYVIFILATTEVHRIPITILSRCQRYDLRRITPDIIVERLKELMDKEGEQVEEKALKYIAKMADGAMRDALSLLDQCIAFYLGEMLTYDKVIEVLGAVDLQVFQKMLHFILKDDLIGAIALLDKMIMKGRDLNQFINDFGWYLRNLMLIKATEDAENMVELSKEQIEALKEEATLLQMEQIIRYISVFSELAVQIKYANSKRIYIEMALVKLCNPSMETNQNAILERLRVVEKKIESGVVARQPMVQLNGREAEIEEVPEVVLQKAIPEDIKEVVRQWNQVIANTDNPMKTYLKHGKVSMNHAQELVIVYEDEMDYNYFVQEGKIEELKSSIASIIQKDVDVKVEFAQSKQEQNLKYVDVTSLGINIEIDIEEESKSL